MVLAPWCERIACEEEVKNRTKATGEVKAEEPVEGEEAEDAALGPRGLTGAAKTLNIPFVQVRSERMGGCSLSCWAQCVAGVVRAGCPEPHGGVCCRAAAAAAAAAAARRRCPMARSASAVTRQRRHGPCGAAAIRRRDLCLARRDVPIQTRLP